jgi:hypothetical protein
MEIIGHERDVNFPIGRPLRLPSLQEYSYQRYDDSQRRNYNGYEVHGNTILLQAAERGWGVTPFAIVFARL